MPGRYAASTYVSVEKSQGEIRTTLKRYGATGFAYAEDDDANAAMIVFRLSDRHYRIYVPIPQADDPSLRKRVHQYTYADNTSPAALEQARRQRWRAVVLYIKAILEAVESGIVSAEQALLSHLLLPNGQTMGQATVAPIDEMYQSGQMQPLLPGLTGRALPEGPAPDAPPRLKRYYNE
jgi:hypothetical protein